MSESTRRNIAKIEDEYKRTDHHCDGPTAFLEYESLGFAIQRWGLPKPDKKTLLPETALERFDQTYMSDNEYESICSNPLKKDSSEFPLPLENDNDRLLDWNIDMAGISNWNNME